MSSICQAPWDGVVAHFSGAIYACDSMSQGAEMQQMILGNIREQSLAEILQGEKIQGLRSALLHEELEGYLCQSCHKSGTCNLYGDPEVGRVSGEKKSLSVSKSLKLKRLELGLTDLCNMKCTMCCLSRGEASPPFVPKNGMMDISLAKKLIREFMALADENPLVLLHWVGEPLIYPKLEELLAEIGQYSCRLHLVSNGINLNQKIIDQLFSLQGEHALNVSLNAVDDLTYQKINQVNQYAKVLKNIGLWLETRKKIAAGNWSFIASAVVLEENYQEIPRFVDFWREKLQHFGTVDIGLNGKGVSGINQIQILCELENPLSKMYFREALRLSNLEYLQPDLKSWNAVDSIMLGRKNLSSALDGQVEQLELLLFGSWSDEEILDVLAQFHDKEERLTPHLRRLAFQENRNLLRLPFTPKQSSQLLLWMKLVPSAQEELAHSLQHMVWTVQDVEDLAVLLHWYPSFRHQLSAELQLPKTADASWFIVNFALGVQSVLQAFPLDWQVEAIAGLISQLDHSQLAFQLAVDLKPSEYAHFLALASDTNPENLEKCCLSLQKDTPDWLIRAIRRRWFFRQSTTQEVFLHHSPFQNRELALLYVMIGDQPTQKRALTFLRRSLEGTTIETIGQDLSEILLIRPSIRSFPEFVALLRHLFRQASCPLLSFSSAYLLGLAVLSAEAKSEEQEKLPLFLENIQMNELEFWQQKQWEALALRAKEGQA